MVGFKKIAPEQPKGQQDQDKQVYPAKPLKGDVDHESHLQSILKRFSKTIAYLGR